MNTEESLRPVKVFFKGEIANWKCPSCGEFVHPVVTPESCPACKHKLKWDSEVTNK